MIKPSKFLGIDYGTKRIGLAISDENGSLAFPKQIISNDKNVLEKIEKMVREEGVGELVVGESLDSAGKKNLVSKDIDIFISKLKKVLSLPIHFQKEFMSSVEARRGENLKTAILQTGAHSKVKKSIGEKVDAKAAAIILQRYLDRRSRQ